MHSEFNCCLSLCVADRPTREPILLLIRCSSCLKSCLVHQSIQSSVCRDQTCQLPSSLRIVLLQNKGSRGVQGRVIIFVWHADRCRLCALQGHRMVERCVQWILFFSDSGRGHCVLQESVAVSEVQLGLQEKVHLQPDNC